MKLLTLTLYCNLFTFVSIWVAIGLVMPVSAVAGWRECFGFSLFKRTQTLVASPAETLSRNSSEIDLLYWGVSPETASIIRADAEMSSSVAKLTGAIELFEQIADEVVALDLGHIANAVTPKLSAPQNWAKENGVTLNADIIFSRWSQLEEFNIPDRERLLLARALANHPISSSSLTQSEQIARQRLRAALVRNPSFVLTAQQIYDSSAWLKNQTEFTALLSGGKVRRFDRKVDGKKAREDVLIAFALMFSQIIENSKLNPEGISREIFLEIAMKLTFFEFTDAEIQKQVTEVIVDVVLGTTAPDPKLNDRMQAAFRRQIAQAIQEVDRRAAARLDEAVRQRMFANQTRSPLLIARPEDTPVEEVRPSAPEPKKKKRRTESGGRRGSERIPAVDSPSASPESGTKTYRSVSVELAEKLDSANTMPTSAETLAADEIYAVKFARPHDVFSGTQAIQFSSGLIKELNALSTQESNRWLEIVQLGMARAKSENGIKRIYLRDGEGVIYEVKDATSRYRILVRHFDDGLWRLESLVSKDRIQ